MNANGNVYKSDKSLLANFDYNYKAHYIFLQQRDNATTQILQQ